MSGDGGPEQDPRDEIIEVPDVLTVLPLKDTVIFPFLILPLSIADDETVRTVDRALSDGRVLMLAAQKDPEVDRPGPDDLYEVGTAATIMRLLKLPDGRTRILVQGLCRAKLEHVSRSEPFLMARISRVHETPTEVPELELEARVRSVREGLERAAALGRGISPEVLGIAADVTEPGRLADLVAGNLDLPVEEAQGILETADPLHRLTLVGDLLTREIQVLTMQAEISSQARGEMDRSQREYYLRQQLKAIQDELGEGDDEMAREIAEYRRLAEEKSLPEEAVEEMDRQIRRLERSHPDSAETTIQRTYLDWLTALPWGLVSEDQLDLDHARDALDSDHYGLEKVKERILEHLAVQILSTRRTGNSARGPLLCFVGPPGVGKTSLGRAIARALGRQFVRLSLGGVRDEAEIRGHRRTYVGALPGRILQGLRRAGTNNPVFMLDEIDKIGADHRGDPSSALLEVLDPEQNDTFTDHYLGLPYDLSRVLFITTANLLDPIQPAFLDRMEVIRLTGYTPEEKLTIARRHLLPRQREASGLTEGDITITEDGVRKVIADYTREAGLRNLERELASLCRKVAVTVADRPEPEATDTEPTAPTGEADADEAPPAAAQTPPPESDPESPPEPAQEPVVIDAEKVVEYLGPPRHHAEELLDRDRVGVATGLAWTAAGGDLMFIEALRVPGQGKLHLTGQLGEVMKESGQTALTYARAWADAAGLDRDELLTHDIHVHAPAGSIPKDGPSAGITIAVALISALSGRPVRRRVAMTGEITLRGDVMPIGGLKEKVMAARLAGVETVLAPRLNERDLGEIPDNIRGDLTFHLVDHMDEVLERALGAGDSTA